MPMPLPLQPATPHASRHAAPPSSTVWHCSPSLEPPLRLTRVVQVSQEYDPLLVVLWRARRGGARPGVHDEGPSQAVHARGAAVPMPACIAAGRGRLRPARHALASRGLEPAGRQATGRVAASWQYPGMGARPCISTKQHGPDVSPRWLVDLEAVREALARLHGAQAGICSAVVPAIRGRGRGREGWSLRGAEGPADTSTSLRIDSPGDTLHVEAVPMEGEALHHVWPVGWQVVVQRQLGWRREGGGRAAGLSECSL